MLKSEIDLLYRRSIATLLKQVTKDTMLSLRLAPRDSTMLQT